MEPLGVAANVVAVVEITLRATSALVEYTSNTRDASADRKLLANESRVLVKLLERLLRRTSIADPAVQEWLEERQDLARQFSRAYEDFAAVLKLDPTTGRPNSQSHGKAFWNIATWSFTKSQVYAVLERITRLQLYANTLLLDDQHSLVERIKDRQQDAQLKELRSDILDWLTPLQMSKIHETISKRPEAGSGRWFLTSSQFRAWQAGKLGLLWCPGIPGAGKTVLASIIVEYLRQHRTKREVHLKEIGVSIVYIKYNDHQQTLENIIGSILSQLIQELEAVPPALSKSFEQHQKQNTSPSLQELVDVLTDVLKPLKTTYIIVDALDECTEEIRWELMEILRSEELGVQLLLTSRFLDNIEEELEGAERLEIKANKADLELYMDRHILKNRNLRKLVEKNPSIRQDVKSAVVATAADMFLLARLHVESLSSAAALSIKHVRKKLESLPTTLTATYDEAISRIDSQEYDHKNIAMKTLAWVSYAFRPLSLGELQHALAIEPDGTELDEEDIMDGTSITALCAGLVIIDPGTNIVNLVHYTTKSYFESIRSVRFPGFHAKITMSCATYLALESLRNASIWTIVRDFPLACYAAQYMGDHARLNPEDALELGVLEVIYRLLSHPEKCKPLLSLLDSLDLIRSGFYHSKISPGTIVKSSDSLVGETLVSPTLNEDPTSEDYALDGNEIGQEPLKRVVSDTTCTSSAEGNVQISEGLEPVHIVNRMPEVTALHLAASMGLARVASLLIKDTGDIDALDETGKTALALAIERGFEKAVEFLVTSGARVDLTSEHGQSVFLLITERDWHSIADIIAAKAETNVRRTKAEERRSEQVLLAAYRGDCFALRKALELNSDENGYQAPDLKAIALFVSVERQHQEAVKVLLGDGVDINSTDSAGQSVLHRATRRGDENMLRLLLKLGAEIDRQDDEGRTPWSSNLRTGNERILDVLLEEGANPNTKGLQGVNELYIAAQNGETSLVRYMLKSGTEPSIRTQFDWAPLHWAAYYGHTECVKLLMNAGTELSPISDQDASPLDLAIRANQIAIVDVLVKAGAKESRDIEISTRTVTARTQDDHHASPQQTNRPNRSDSRLKIALTFDKPIQQGLLIGQFIYPTVAHLSPDRIYQISNPLETPSTALSVRIAERRADMVEYPLPPGSFDASDVLYHITCESPDYQRLSLCGGKQGSSSFAGTIRMVRDWTGGWKVRHHIPSSRQQQQQQHPSNLHTNTWKADMESSEYLFRTTPDWSKMKEEGCRWMTEEGKLLARTGMEDVTPTLCFDHGVEKPMQDVLVSCWVGKLWSEAVAGQMREGEKASHT